ncbi:MAG: hypothetical protein Q9205_006000 [Flavoplaca limonia]
MDFFNASTSSITTKATPLRILPKRKRKETTYYPSDSESDLEGEGGDVEKFDSDIDEAPSAKSYPSSPAIEATAKEEDLPLRLAPSRAEEQDLLLRPNQRRTHPSHLEAERSLPPHRCTWRHRNLRQRQS